MLLWHERYFSFCSRETLDRCNNHTRLCSSQVKNVVKNLNVYPKYENLELTNGIFFSRGAFRIDYNRLLEESYKIVQKMQCGMEGKFFFYSKITSDKKITNKIPVNKLKVFDFSYHTKKLI